MPASRTERTRCPRAALPAMMLAACLVLAAGADEWPQWRGPARDGVWKEQGLVQKFSGPEIPVRWRVPVSGGYSGPTVAGGRVYLTDRVVEPKQQERVLCFDWQTGRTLWSHAYDAPYGGVSYPAGPRASVTVDDGRAYSLGALGHLYCFDAAKGTVLWHRDLNTEYRIDLPTWGIAGAPLVEKDLVICQIGGKEDACVVALDRKTGRERWRALGDPASYSAPMMISQAGKRVLVCWTADRVVGMDPSNGKLHWEHPFPRLRWPIGIATPVLHGDLLFLSSAIDGSLMLRVLPDRMAVEKVWQYRSANEQDPGGLHSLISTPLLIGSHIYGIHNSGELRCLDARTGERRWESKDVVPINRWAAAHLVRNGDRVWIFNERGQLIIARLAPAGYEEISRAQLIGPTLGQLPDRRRGGVCWSHPAFAYQHVFARNDEELVCASLKAP